MIPIPISKNAAEITAILMFRSILACIVNTIENGTAKLIAQVV